MRTLCSGILSVLSEFVCFPGNLLVRLSSFASDYVLPFLLDVRFCFNFPNIFSKFPQISVFAANGVVQ